MDRSPTYQLSRPLHIVALIVLTCASLHIAAHAQQATATPTPPGVAFDITVPPLSNDYPLTPDSLPHDGVPKGTIIKFDLNNSKTFPSTSRTISVYIPAQYNAAKPACVFVLLGGLGFYASAVFDNLIAQHQMPITIAIGIAPGSVSSSSDATLKRYDRSFEFDNRTSRLSTFIIDEVLPAVESQKLADGRRISLSKDPSDRAIGGSSTGGIGAFNVAWQRPDAFRRVFISIGTFVGMRGGEQDYVQVRKTEPKPLRIFMQDGAHDGWPGGLEMGDWWMSNQTMERALTFAGYDVRHVWGSGNHNSSQAEQLFPDAVRWLWRDWPAPIVALPPASQALTPILLPGEPWKKALEGCSAGLHLASGQDGSVLIPGTSNSAATKLNGATTCLATASPLAVAADGRTYTAQQSAVSVYAPNGTKTLTARGLNATALAATNSGNLYLAADDAAGKSDIWLINAHGDKLNVAAGLNHVSALALTPDAQWLFAAQPDSHLSYSFRILPDGKLDSGEPFYDLYIPADADGSGALSVAMDREGRAYVATKLGVQVCDHNGRVIAILPLPNNGPAESLAFGGDDFTTLYVSSQGTVYTRKLKIGGTFPAGTPRKIPNWGAG